MSKIRLGILGAGRIAQANLDIISSIKTVKVIKIYSRTKKKAKLLKKKYSINEVSETLEEFICKDLDGILILVSAEEIFKMTMMLLPYKIPLFIEKPLSLNFSDYKKLVKVNKKYQTLNMIGLNRRFYSVFHRSLELIKKRKDKILAVNIEGHERSWLLKKKVNKKILQRWIFANSIHTIDLLNFFCGDLIYSHTLSHKNKNNIPQYVTGIFKFKSGIVANYTSYWNSPGSWKVSIFTKEFNINFSPLEKAEIIDKKFKKVNLLPSNYDVKYKPGFYKQLLAFIDLIKYKKIIWPALSIETSYETYKNLKLLEK